MWGIGVAHGLVAITFLLPGMAISAQQTLSIDGTVAYRERMALPPDAVFEATLEDVSRADAPATIIGQARIEQPGNPPFRFTIQYDPTQIQPNHIYSVRARITEGGRLLFTTDQRYQVLTQGHGSEIGMMMLRRVAGAAGKTPIANTSLRETYWKLVQLGDRPIHDGDQQQEANLVFRTDGSRVTGSGGCNRLTGAYTVNDQSLRIQGIASTRMACTRGMEIENRFLASLEHVRSWKISDRQLELDDEDGRPLARFTAETMKSE